MAVFLVAVDELFRRGLQALLEGDRGLEVVGAATDADGASALVELLPVDVVLMELEGRDGLDLGALSSIRDGRGLEPRLVVLATEVPPAGSRFQPREPPHHLLPRGCALEELVAVLKEGSDGPVDADGTRLARRHGGVATLLTDRQLEVLCLVAQGLNNRDVAEALFLAENTVKNHVRNILGKLGVRTRVQAAMVAVRDGLLDPHELLVPVRAAGARVGPPVD